METGTTASFREALRLDMLFSDDSFTRRDDLTDIRGYGMLGGLDLMSRDRPGSAGAEAFDRLYKKGVLVKATGDAVLIAPPLIAEPAHVAAAVDRLREVLFVL